MGIFSKKRKTDVPILIHGMTESPDTMKCLLTAAEKGFKVTFDAESHTEDESPILNGSPTLESADFSVKGAAAILSYLDIKGKGGLVPRKATLMGQQNYWIDVANTNVAPVLLRLQNGAIEESSARAILGDVFNELNEQLKGKEYIIGDYSFADVYWTVYVHQCMQYGTYAKSYPILLDLIEGREEIRQWYERVKSRTSSIDNETTYQLMQPSYQLMLRSEQ